MAAETGKQRLTVVTACLNAVGMADFALTEVEVTADEIKEGIHLYLAQADLLEAGYEEPFVSFPEDEAPAFLIPAVKEYLRVSGSAAAPTPNQEGGSQCPV